MRLQDPTGHSHLPRSRKARAVLAILAITWPRPVLRARLIGLLWSRREKEQAQASLRQCVHELRRALGPLAGSLLQITRNHLTLLADQLWVDTRVFARSSADHPQSLELFQTALLDDLTGLDQAFDQWLADQRQKMAQHARGLAEKLLATQRGPAATIAAARNVLAIDDCHEGAWQALIRAHMENGDRAAAQQALQQCTITLAHAGLTISQETGEQADETAIVRRPPQRPLYRFAVVAGRDVPTPARHRGDASSIRLAVLPPRSLDGDRHDALSLGLSEELITALSRFRWISCVASTWLPIGEPQTSNAWQQLGLDFLLDGTIQRVGDRVRVICRLLDMHAGGRIVWARRFDRQLGDVLALQDEIASETAAQIDPELLIREGERLLSRGIGDPTAHDLLLRAIPAIYRLEPVGFREAGDTLAAALAMDPANAAAHAWWAYWHLFQVGQGWAPDPAGATRRAAELAERAVTLDPGDARALTLVGHVRGFLHKRTEEACALHERALSLNPNLPLAWCFAGFANSYLGRHQEAIEQISHAQHLSPHDPHGFFFDMALMMPHFLQGDFETVVTIGRRAIELNPSCSSTYKGYLATLGHLRRDREAATVLARLLALEPGFSVRNAIERSPMRRADDVALYAEGLRRAGLREG
jgi:TolB-like protein/DNA-binding SARP family transcriptional activator